MAIVAPGPAAATIRARFAPVLWHDDHPDRLQLGRQLPAEHLARQVEADVDRLDLQTLHACYHGTGSEPHPPALLLAVALYDTRLGRHSPAQWHYDADNSAPVSWLLRGCRPSRTCWYDFRDRIAPLLRELNAQPLAQAVAEGLTPATRAATDGTLVAANASRHRLCNQTTLDRRAEQLRSAVAADRAEGTPAAVAPGATPPAETPAPEAAEAAPAPEALAPPEAAPEATPAPEAAAVPVPGWMAKQPAGRLAQLERFGQAQQQMAQRQARNRGKKPSKQTAADRLVVSTADPEAALGLDKEKVFRPLYNIQVVDDLDSPLILGYEVFAQPNDAGLLGTMLATTRKLVGHSLRVLLADTGYAGGADLRAASLAGVTVYAPLPKEEDPAGAKQLPKSAFVWLAQEQTYQCPQGQRLVLEAQGQSRRSGPEYLEVQRYRCPPAHCQACPLRQRCAKNPATGRTVSRSEYEDEVEALRQRMASPEAQALYKLRRETVELVNADWKEHRKLRRFSGRGLTRVRAQVGLIVLTHNLLALRALEKKAKAKAAESAANASQVQP